MKKLYQKKGNIELYTKFDLKRNLTKYLNNVTPMIKIGLIIFTLLLFNEFINSLDTFNLNISNNQESYLIFQNQLNDIHSNILNLIDVQEKEIEEYNN